MKRVAKVASPAAIAVLRQATALYPKRKKTIRRWIITFVQHIRKASPSSDHNTGLAVDLTHDPDNGIDCTLIFEKLERR
jgi:D-alanyl-D-alanine dipeptidase